MAIIKTLIQAGAVLGALGMVSNMQKKKHENQNQDQNQNRDYNNNNGYNGSQNQYSQGQQGGHAQGYYNQGQEQQNGYARDQNGQPPIYREAEHGTSEKQK
jgi:hypothetical protein